jgi:hypothetical protein
MCAWFAPLLYIYTTEEWKVQPNLATPEQVPDKHPTSVVFGVKACRYRQKSAIFAVIF